MSPRPEPSSIRHRHCQAPSCAAPVVVALVAALVFVASTSAVTRGQETQSRDRVMYVSVVDANQSPVTGLGPSDFVVREDGVQREVLRVEPATAPIEMTIMMDNSGVAEPAIADMRRALTGYVGEMAKGNEIAITTFGGPPMVLQTYTANPGLLSKAIGRLFSARGTGTYLLDALLSVADGIRKRAPERAEILAVVMRSSPEFSDMAPERAVSALTDCGARFDAIVVQRPGEETPPVTGERGRAMRDRDTVLDEGSRTTGGRNDLALSSLSLVPLMTSLGTELRSQYRLVYARPESLIPPQNVQVSVKKPGLTARGTPVKVRR
jgi:VWFA-related protein